MSLTAGKAILLSSAAGGGYEVSRSLRFNSSDSAYLSRAVSTAGDRKKWTWAGWIKRADLSGYQSVFYGGTDGNNRTGFAFYPTGAFAFYNRISSSTTIDVSSNAVFRDTSAWYHFVVVFDSANATAAQRLRLYVNGVEQTFASNPVTQNSELLINAANNHWIGREPGGADLISLYLADVFFIDGQALDPSSFVETSATTGQLIPKQYTGSFGTNGFWLKFSDNSAATATTLGKDYSGNSNNWTPNNLSVTAGAGNDSLTDSPTSYGTGSGGGDVRGNFCTWNPLAKFGDITQTLNVSNGNLTFSGSSNIGTIGTIGMSSGKWYWELNCTSLTASQLYFGMTSVTTGSRTASFVGIRDTGVLSGSANGATTNGSGTTAFTTGDVVGFAYDADNKRLFVAKNNTWLNSADPAAGTNASFTDVQGSSLYPFISDNNTTATIDANWGARPFAYTAPSGFKALCDTNLPAPVVAKPNTVMDVKLYTGNGGTQTISGLGFSPDLVWIKNRNTAYDHELYDTVRGVTNRLMSSFTGAEDVRSGVTAFNSDGFSLGSAIGANASSSPNVAWCFDAGANTVTNTQGSITSQVRANPSAGFSVVAWTKSPAGAHTVGHGLSVAPQLVIVKSRSLASEWAVYHASLGATKFLKLNTTDAAGTVSAYWNDTAPTSTTISLGSWSNLAGDNIAYCFAPVAGYSSFGSYTGNGSADGPFVFTGMRPRWLLIKQSSASGENWIIYDAAREPANVAKTQLYPNLSNAEFVSGTSPNGHVDILSNGFKCRETTGGTNGSGATYIYAAFAESPFAYSRAR